MAVDAKLSPVERLLVGAFTVAMAAGGFAAGRLAFPAGERVKQPIAFDHRKHVQGAGIECSTCHQFYATGRHSGLPDLTTCMTCHQSPITSSPEERKLIALAARPSPPTFRKLFRLPDHVFYSHRRHVTIARLACSTCHGGIADSTSPPERPLVAISMSSCTGCHTRVSVQTDCTACHR